MRGTEAGMDLWLTFEIREHGELGENDHVCVYTHVMGGIKVTSAFCVTKYSDSVLVHVKGHPTLLITPSFSILSSFLTLWTQVLGFPSSPKKAFLPPLPTFQILEEPRVQPQTLFLSLSTFLLG